MMSSSRDAVDGIASGATERGWQSFRLIGGIAALFAALVFRRWLNAEFGMLQSLGVIHLPLSPSTPLEWLTLLHVNAFVGLLKLNVFDLVNYVLVAVMYLGIYSLIRNHYKAYARLAMVCTIAGTSIYLTSNQALNLLSLSNQYFAQASDVQKPLILAAGQFALTVNDPVVFGTGTFWSYLLLYFAGLILSIIMLRIDLFGRCIGIVGIVANAFGLGYFVTSFFGRALSIIPALGSAPANLVWYIAVGIQLVRNVDGKA
jgi:hypothetical protein